MEVIDTINGVDIVRDTNSRNTGGSLSNLAEEFDNFLTLLTTQLQYQDPTSPMESQEFTQQLIGFAEVEQSIAGNERLDQLLEMSAQQNPAVGYIGQIVTAEGNTVELRNGKATFNYEIEGQAREHAIYIQNSSGVVVKQVLADGGAGKTYYEWDGITDLGADAEDGFYTYTIIALDREGKELETNSYALGRITGVSFEDGDTKLEMGSQTFALDDVLSVRAPEETLANNDTTNE